MKLFLCTNFACFVAMVVLSLKMWFLKIFHFVHLFRVQKLCLWTVTPMVKNWTCFCATVIACLHCQTGNSYVHPYQPTDHRPLLWYTIATDCGHSTAHYVMHSVIRTTPLALCCHLLLPPTTGLLRPLSYCCCCCHYMHVLQSLHVTYPPGLPSHQVTRLPKHWNRRPSGRSHSFATFSLKGRVSRSEYIIIMCCVTKSSWWIDLWSPTFLS